MKVAARLISVFFHPLLIPTYLFLLLSYALPLALFPIPMSGHPTFILLVFLVTVLLPILNIGIFKLTGFISSVTLYNRQERIIPFLFMAILYGVFTYLFYSKFGLGLHDNVLKLMLIMDLLVLIAALITCVYKISVHSLCIAGMLGILLPFNKASDNGLLMMPTLIVLILVGLVMTARLQLNAHKPAEVWWGALVGFAVSFAGVFVFF